MIHFSKPCKPCKIWVVTSWEEDNGTLYENRAFKYKCEAQVYHACMIKSKGLAADITEMMLY